MSADFTSSIDVIPGQPLTFRTPTWQSNEADPAYSSGKVTKLNKDFRPQNISGDAAIAEAWSVSNARARDLVRNDPILKKSLTMMTALTIGPGIDSYCEAVDANRQFMDEFCEESDELFTEWALEEADATGRQTFWDMQELSFKEMATTGLSIWLEVINSDPTRSSPLSYQLLEYEQIDRSKDRPAARGQTRIRNGIEFDRFNRAVAVWMHDEHPFEFGGNAAGTLTSKRIPIRRLILNYRPDRVSAHVGITWFNCMVQTARDTDRMVANEVTARAVKALMTLFVKRKNPGTCIADGLNAEDVDTGQSPIRMGYPAIVEIGSDESVEVAESKAKSGEDADAFISLLVGQFAMGAGLSRHRLTGNAGESNMASVRAGHLDDERVVAPIQRHQVDKVVRRIRRRHQDLAVASGKFSGLGITSDFYNKNRRRMRKFFIIAAGDPDFEPKQDGEASIDRMRSGRTTPQFEIARTGTYWRSNIRQIKQYFEELERNDLGSPDWTKGAGGTFLPFVKTEDQPVMNQGGRPAEKGAAAEK